MIDSNPPPGNTEIENIIFADIRVGQSAQLARTLLATDIDAFAAVSGDVNPAHLDAEYASHTLFQGVIAHGMWSGALISTLLGTRLPGPGTIYVGQSLDFVRPVRVGDTLVVTVTVTAKHEAGRRVILACEIVNQRGERVLTGTATVIAPDQKLRMPVMHAPQLRVFDPVARREALLARVRGLAPVRCGVVHPCDAGSIAGALAAARRGLIEPVLIGPEAKIRAAAASAGLDIAGITLEPVPHSHAAAEFAAEQAAAGRLEALMKGSLHTDELIGAVLARRELRTARRMSHVFRFDVPMHPRPLLLTDAALNIQPTLEEKADIVQNAIALARALGLESPRAAILAAVETVNPRMPATLDAAALCKMAQRGQITGGVLDGPLAFDNAISAEAARIKGIDSPVAGQADILVVPDLESGNMLAKQLEYLAGAMSSGVVLGARLPIALTSRADGENARIGSAALALLLARRA